jgi:hypothetical protein
MWQNNFVGVSCHTFNIVYILGSGRVATLFKVAFEPASRVG